MGDDASHGHLLHQPRQLVEFDRALLAIQKPIHVRVLHKSEESLAWGHFFHVRRPRFAGTRGEQIDHA